MPTHKALGRGLEALFSSSPNIREGLTKEAIRELFVDQIKPNRYQPRTNFDPAGLEELSQSIKTHGLTQPLVVTETSEGDYELVVGERRLRASRMAGLTKVPCLVKKFSNRERFEVALIENLQREDLNALEEALALDKLMKEYNLTQDDVATALGKSRSSVANILRLLNVHEEVQSALQTGKISEGHAKCLAGVQEHAEQLRLLKKIIENQFSVRDLEAYLSGGKPAKKGDTSPSRETSVIPEVRKYEEEFQRVLGRRVEIQSTGKKGWIKFAFYSPWDLELLCKRLGLIDPNKESPTFSES